MRFAAESASGPSRVSLDFFAEDLLDRVFIDDHVGDSADFTTDRVLDRVRIRDQRGEHAATRHILLVAVVGQRALGKTLAGERGSPNWSYSQLTEFSGQTFLWPPSSLRLS